MSRILMKTTIPPVEDDWNVGRFSRLSALLSSLEDDSGRPRHQVTARDRIEDEAGDDEDLKRAAGGEFDQIWLIAADVTNALSDRDVERLEEFRKAGGGLFLTRDHQDLGMCLSRLGALGRTQHFQTANPEPDEKRRCCDDSQTPAITWPNYHSGANGDLQPVTIDYPPHPIMRSSDGGVIDRIPGHPHEGAVGVPEELRDVARVVAMGRSRTTGAMFNLCVTVEEPGFGRAIADSSFHHIADYNWDPRAGAPSFVVEPPGDEVLRDPRALDGVCAYVANAAAWLGERPSRLSLAPEPWAL